MKKKCLALFCAILLAWPALSFPEAEMWQCDSCDANGPASVVTGEEGWSGDYYGREISYYCSSCGALLSSSWQELSPPAAPEPQPEPQPQPVPEPQPQPQQAPEPQPQPEPQPEPEPAAQPEPEPQPEPAAQPEAEPQAQPQPEPEAPAAPPADNPGAGDAGGGAQPAPVSVSDAPESGGSEALAVNPALAAPEPPAAPPAEPQVSGGSAEKAAVNTGDEVPVQPPAGGEPPVSSGQTQGDLPPVISQPGDSAPQAAPPEVEAPAEAEEEPEAWDAVNDPPVTQPSAGTQTPWRNTRNLQKYPVFSTFWPSRRLNMEGDPEAKAPIPGEKIWPVSFLDHLTK